MNGGMHEQDAPREFHALLAAFHVKPMDACLVIKYRTPVVFASSSVGRAGLLLNGTWCGRRTMDTRSEIPELRRRFHSANLCSERAKLPAEGHPAVLIPASLPRHSMVGR